MVLLAAAFARGQSLEGEPSLSPVPVAFIEPQTSKVQRVVPAGTPFDLPPRAVVVWYGTSRDLFSLECSLGGAAQIEVSAFGGEGAGLAFEKAGQLEEGGMLLRIPLFASRIALRASEALGSCSVAILTTSLTESQWRRTVFTAGETKKDAREPLSFELKVLEAQVQGRWSQAPLARDSTQWRASAAVLGAPLSASALSIRRLLVEKPFCASRPEWRAARVRDVRDLRVEAGFVELQFWPDREEGIEDQEVCFDLIVDAVPVPRRCVESSPALDRQARLLDPNALLRADDGRAIGAPIHIRLGLDRTRHLSLRPVGRKGWLSVRWFAPKTTWGEERIALPGLIVAFPMNPPQEQELGWQILSPAQSALSVRSRLVLFPLSPQAREQAQAAHKDQERGLWIPVGSRSVASQPDERGRNRVELLFERKGQPGTPCAVTASQQAFAGALLEELTSATLLLPRAMDVPLKVEGDCAVWHRTSWRELPAQLDSTARTLVRFLSVEPGQSLPLPLPGPSVEGLAQLRVFADEDADAADGALIRVEVGGRSKELAIFGQGPGRLVRRPLRLLPEDRGAVVRNLADVPVWVALAIRAPVEPEEPLSTPQGAEAKTEGESDHLFADAVALRLAMEKREPAQRTTDELLRLSRRLCALAEVSLARDVLALAAQKARTEKELEAVRQEDEDQRRSLDSLTAALEAGLIVPLSRWLLPVATAEVGKQRLPPLLWRRGAAMYDVALALRGRFLENPSQTTPSELLLVHSIAVRESDFLLSAYATFALRGAGENISTDIAWLRELVWAAQDGQYVPDEWRLLGAVLASLHAEKLGPKLEPLRRALLALTTLEETQAFFGVERTVLLPSEKVAQDDGSSLLRFGEAWDPRLSLELGSGDKRLLELTLPSAVDARLEVQWAVRLDEDGKPPRCQLVLRTANQDPVVIPPASDPLDAGSRTSPVLRLASGPSPVLVELACDDLRDQARARMRLWLGRPLAGVSAKAWRSLEGMTELLVLRGPRRWLALSPGKTASIDVLGPTTLRVTALAQPPNGQPAALLRCAAPQGPGSVKELWDSEEVATSVEISLYEVGTHKCQLEARRPLVFTGAYRRPDASASLLRRSLSLEEQVAYPQRAFVDEEVDSELSPGRMSGTPRSAAGPGTVWAGWMAAEDSVVRENDEPRPWVTGPRAGWHSRGVDGMLWWKIDTELRIRPTGSPAGLAQAAAVFLPGLDLVLKPRVVVAWQEIDGALGWSLRGSLEAEYELELSRRLRLVPFLGIRGAWSRVKSVEGIGARQVDSAVFNAYLAEHAAALYPGLTLKLRPIDPLLLQGELRYVTNEQLNPADPERLDLDFDAFAGFDFGLVARLSAGLSTRFADDDRKTAQALPSIGGGLSYAWWMSPRLALFAHGSGNYIFILNSYDASAFLGLVLSFGGGLGDEHPSWTPLPSYLEARRPRDAAVVPRH
jgi:hypothetical protein